MTHTNQRIKLRMKARGVTMWQLADALHVSENTLYRRFRYQLDEKETNKICLLVDSIAKGESE